MYYVSTRNKEDRRTAAQAIAQGLAADGGLMTPEVFPKLSQNALETMRDMSYQQRAVYIMKLFLDEFSVKELTEFAAAAYGPEKFDTPAVAPVRALDDGTFCLELPAHPESILRQMAREAGCDRWDDLPRLRECLRRTFPWVWDWLRSLPTILESEHLVFVHGGVPSLDRMEELDAWHCMKNDDYWGQGHSFAHTGKYVVVGHWPVTLYDPRIPSAAPIIDRARHIISIDGGCVLKLDGQLNALIIPEESSPDFSWTAYDGLPTARALDPQAPSEDSLNIRWGRNRVEVLERGPELSLCRHLETGRVLPILTSYLYDSPEELRCEDSTDYLLPVVPGDCLSIVARTGEMGQSLIDQISKLLPSNTSWFRRSRGCPQFNHNLIVILSLFSRLRRLSTCGWIRRCGRIGSGIFLGGTAKQSSRHDQCKG